MMFEASSLAAMAFYVVCNGVGFYVWAGLDSSAYDHRTLTWVSGVLFVAGIGGLVYVGVKVRRLIHAANATGDEPNVADVPPPGVTPGQ